MDTGRQISTAASTLKILVVDDHLLVREGLKEVLKQVDSDVQIFESSNVAGAFRVAEAHGDLDLILLDLVLPDASGFTALQGLRRDHGDIPVVVLSASTEPSDAVRCIKGGAAGFIPKSSSAGVLLGAVRLVLSGGVYLPPEVLLAQCGYGEGEKPFAALDEAGTARTRIDAAAFGLTDRQAQVLALLIKGKSNKEIGRALDLAEQTVKTHISGVLRALNVTTRAQAIVAVAQLGIKLNSSNNRNS
jgi:DNA-binding NarL/FixJ family response regulator